MITQVKTYYVCSKIMLAYFSVVIWRRRKVFKLVLIRLTIESLLVENFIMLFAWIFIKLKYDLLYSILCWFFTQI